MKDTDLTEGSVWKKLLAFALPIFAANLLQSLYGTVDLLIVGQFAETADVSAVSTGSMTMQTINGIIIGLTMGCTVLLGQNIGRRDSKAATRTVASSLALFSAVGVLFSVLVVLCAYPVAQVMNAPAEALDGTVSYIRICGAGCIFIVLFNALSGMFRGIGDSRTPLILVAVACVANIFGDLLCVDVLQMGASGAALATVAAQALSVLFIFLRIRRRGFGFETVKTEFRPARYEISKILRFGLPIAGQELMTGVSFMVILAVLNTFGLTASAGVGVAEKICGLMFIVPGAIMSALSAFSAQNVGAGKYRRALQGMYVCMAFGLAVGVVMFLISFTNGAALSGIFSKDADVCAASGDYLRSYSIDCMLVAINFSMMGFLNGNGRTGFVALQGILSTFLVRIPVSYFMSKVPGVSLFQVGFATPLATTFAIIITVIYLLRFLKKERTNFERKN